MSARVYKGGASASPDRLSKADWLGLAIFAAPMVIAALHSIAGGF